MPHRERVSTSRAQTQQSFAPLPSSRSKSMCVMSSLSMTACLRSVPNAASTLTYGARMR